MTIRALLVPGSDQYRAEIKGVLEEVLGFVDRAARALTVIRNRAGQLGGEVHEGKAREIIEGLDQATANLHAQTRAEQRLTLIRMAELKARLT